MSSLTHLGHVHLEPSSRSALRSTAALGASVLLTVGVLLIIATLVDTWAGS